MRNIFNVKAALLLGSLTAVSGCTGVIDQSSFFPQNAENSANTLVAPSGYSLTDEMLDLPGLGTMHAVRLDNPQSEDVLVYHGGNGNFTADMTQRAQALADATGFDIILYDYPGRGGTNIPPTIDASIATGPTFLDALRQKGWTGTGRLYAYGLSFGGSQAAAMVRGGGFDGLIIEGSAADIASVGRNFIPAIAKPFVRLKIDPALSRFAYQDYVIASKAPVLLISSKNDEIVKPKNMRAFEQELKQAGMTVTLVTVPGPHGTALAQPAGRAVVKAFTAN